MGNVEKNSIRQKYNRREKLLYRIVQDYLIYAEMRLNQEVAGRARNRDDIEKIVQKCKDLLTVLPIPNDEFQDIDANFDFSSILDSLTSVDEILKDGDEWIEKLSKEEQEALKKFDQTK